jgi:hypothetical protein
MRYSPRPFVLSLVVIFFIASWADAREPRRQADENPFADPQAARDPGAGDPDPFAPEKNEPTEANPFGTSRSKLKPNQMTVTVPGPVLSSDPLTAGDYLGSALRDAIPFTSVSSNPRMAAMEQRILQALDRKINFTFNDTPLSEAVRAISAATGIPIGLDRIGMEENGIGIGTPVTAELTNVRLDSALQILLEPHELAFTVRHERLEITTSERVEGWTMVRVYDISSLLATQLELVAPNQSTSDGIVDIIISTVQVESWEDVGGAGVIRAQENLLTVSQGWQIQREVHGLLNAMYTQATGSTFTNMPAFNPAITRIYRLALQSRIRFRVDSETGTIRRHRQTNRRTTELGHMDNTLMPGQFHGNFTNPMPESVSPGPSIKQIARMIKDVIDPPSWNRRQGNHLEVKPGLLIIRQVPENHRAIEQMLFGLGLLKSSRPNAMGHNTPFGGGSMNFPPAGGSIRDSGN